MPAVSQSEPITSMERRFSLFKVFRRVFENNSVAWRTQTLIKKKIEKIQAQGEEEEKIKEGHPTLMVHNLFDK